MALGGIVELDLHGYNRMDALAEIERVLSKCDSST